MTAAFKILALSDILLDFVYSPSVRQRFGDVDLVVSCGDLPEYYLEYVISMLDKPLFYVQGNHRYGESRQRWGEQQTWGGVNLHRNSICTEQGLLLAGVEGSLRYKPGPHLYSQMEMWTFVFGLIPSFFRNRIRSGRYLDLFVSHAPPLDTHDRDDPAHRGVKAFRWLIKVFKPTLYLHGHIHVYAPDEITESLVDNTMIVNAFRFREVEFVLHDQYSQARIIR